MNSFNNFVFGISIIGLLLVCSCHYHSEKYRILELEEIEIEPDPHTHRLKLEINGNFSCETTFYILMDKENRDSIILTGLVDTSYISDWYENILSFEVSSIDCVDHESSIEVYLFK